MNAIPTTIRNMDVELTGLFQKLHVSHLTYAVQAVVGNNEIYKHNSVNISVMAVSITTIITPLICKPP